MRTNPALDFAILDCAMPEMDGHALAQELKRLRPGLPIILLSSSKRPPEGKNPELAACLSKPVRHSTLRDSLISVLGAAPRPSQAPRARFDAMLASRRPLRILVVEDNAINQLALTAAAVGQEAEACLAAGMDAYLSKPLAVDKLVAALTLP